MDRRNRSGGSGKSAPIQFQRRGASFQTDFIPNHGHIDYAFEIDGVPRNGRDHFVDGINCPDAKIGQPVAVYYEKGAPENNYALYPAEVVGNRAKAAFFAGAALFGALIFLGPLFLAWLWTLFSRPSGSSR